MIRILLMSLSAMAVTAAAFAAAAAGNFCGTIDFRSVDHGVLQMQVQLQDSKRLGHITKREQCGLPGEQLALCSACSDTVTPAMHDSLVALTGTREHLGWHSKWHKLRGSAKSLTPSIYSALQAKDLAPQEMSVDEFMKTLGVGGALSGEDFFFMHRMMIEMVQFQLAMTGLPCIAGWSELPASVDDPKWPVPHKRSPEDGERLSKMQMWLTKFRNRETLAKMSLNQLGNGVEGTLHQGLHELYRGASCDPKLATCDDLLPVETSPKNVYFWKLHGLIDTLIGDWLKAHNYREISVKCDGRAGCYEWKTQWVGAYPRS